SIDLFSPRSFRTVSDHCKIRNKTHEPEYCGHREISGNCKYVPEKRRVKVGPKRSVLVRNREYPVAYPYSTHVDYREDGRLYYREDSHRLCRTVNGHSPSLSEQ